MEALNPTSTLTVRDNFIRRRDFVASQLHVLLVCADAAERFLLTSQLRALEYAVTAVGETAAAIALLAGGQTEAKRALTAPAFQLLVLDIAPAHHGGSYEPAITLLRWTSSRINLRELARVVTSFECPIEFVVECMRAGAVDYLHKPCTDAELLSLPSLVKRVQSVSHSRDTDAPDAGCRTAAAFLFRRWAWPARDAHLHLDMPQSAGSAAAEVARVIAEAEAEAKAEAEAILAAEAAPRDGASGAAARAAVAARRPPPDLSSAHAAQRMARAVSRQITTLLDRVPIPPLLPPAHGLAAADEPPPRQPQPQPQPAAAATATPAALSPPPASPRQAGQGGAAAGEGDEAQRPTRSPMAFVPPSLGAFGLPLSLDVSAGPLREPLAEPGAVRLLVLEREERRGLNAQAALLALGFAHVAHCRNVRDAVDAHEALAAAGRRADVDDGPLVASYDAGYHAVLLDVPRDEPMAQQLVRELVSRNLLLPLVCLTESKDMVAVVKAMRLGCVDYILGPPLGRAKARALCALRLGRAELVAAERALGHKRNTDQARDSSDFSKALTGGKKGAQGIASVSDEQAEASLFCAISALHHAAMLERQQRTLVAKAEALSAIGEKHRPPTAAETAALLDAALRRRAAAAAVLLAAAADATADAGARADGDAASGDAASAGALPPLGGARARAEAPARPRKGPGALPAVRAARARARTPPSAEALQRGLRRIRALLGAAPGARPGEGEGEGEGNGMRAGGVGCEARGVDASAAGSGPVQTGSGPVQTGSGPVQTGRSARSPATSLGAASPDGALRPGAGGDQARVSSAVDIVQLGSHTPSSLLRDYGIGSARDNSERHRPELLRWRDELLASPTRRLTPSASSPSPTAAHRPLGSVPRRLADDFGIVNAPPALV